MSTDVQTSYTCPHCGQPGDIPLVAINNCQRYFSKPIFRARCCGFGVRLVPHFSVTLEAAPHTIHTDSFGLSLAQDEI